MNKIVIIAHNIRSSHNVGSIFRTCEGLGVDRVFLTGYTPYPKAKYDTRLPHIVNKLELKINKTSLDSHKHINWRHDESVNETVNFLKKQNFTVVALEQSKNSIPLNHFSSSRDVAVILGNEVNGVDQELIDLADTCVEIPMFGQKESFNVVQATAMLLYQLRFYSM